MASNKDLIKNIEIEATAKGVDVPVTEGKSNAELTQILKDLKAKTAPPPPAPGANDKGADDGKTNDNEDDDPEPDEKSKFEYSVAPGVSITCKGSRILGDGDEITKKDLPAESFKAFLKSGHIKKG